MSRRVAASVFIIVGFVMLPSIAQAQSAIVGVAKDTSGAVLPGVTVAASSDVLIEKTREVITDGQGAYKIVDLRPGTYVVTFTLTGFQTFRRENVELPSEFTATINGDLKVGTIEESVTVSAQSPIVDVTTAVHTQVLSRDAIDSIPTGRTIQGMGQLIVGVSLSLPDTGGARAMQQTYMSTHGMTTANTTVLVDGMMVNGLQSDGSVQSYFNDAMNQEVSYQTSGIGADTQAGGVRLNMIPREGGNRFSGDFKQAYRPGEWQGNNLTQRHKDKGLLSGNATDRIVDYTFAQGGPIKKDALWFFASARYISVNNFIPDTFFDDGSKGVDDQFIKSVNARLTWQISPRNKFSAYFDEVDKYRGHDMQALFDPETAATVWYSPAYHTTSAKWTSPVTNRLLLEAGFSNNTENYTNSYRPDIERVRGTAEWFAGATRSELDLGGRKTAAPSQTTQSPIRYAINVAASYVTGSHNLKFGVQRTWGTFFHTVDAHGDLTQQYRSNSTGTPFTVPDTVIIRNTPLSKYGERLNYDVGIYAQDSWRMNRMTVNLGLRWEALNAQVEGADTPAGRFVPARHFEPITDLPNWRNWAPRSSIVYDLFGNAKTAIKYSVNKYNIARTTGIAEDYNPLRSLGASTATSPALAWRDVNNDDIAQGARGCDFGTNGLPGCEINFSALPANFGSVALNTYGNYPRTWNLEHGLELQHELIPQLSLTGSWFHGDFHNLTTTVNQSWVFGGDPLKNPNYIPFTVYNPGTGETIAVYGRTTAAASAPTLNLDTFDPERKRIYNAFSLEFRARPGRGSQLFGGLSFERQLNVNCTSPDNPNSVRFCDDRVNDIPYNKNFKMAGSYPLPYGITLSGSFQSQVGNSIRGMAATTGGDTMTITRGTSRYPATCPAPCPAGAVILPTTFQPATLVVKLVPDGAVFTERINQLDLKVSKTFKVNRVSILPTLEVFNVTNSDAVVSYVSTNVLAASYLRPNSILQGRIIGIGTGVRW
jgi:hypothetical protein